MSSNKIYNYPLGSPCDDLSKMLNNLKKLPDIKKADVELFDILMMWEECLNYQQCELRKMKKENAKSFFNKIFGW